MGMPAKTGFVRFADMTERERRYYAACRAREDHPNDDILAVLRANVIYANHMQAMSEETDGVRIGADADPRLQAASTAAWRAYIAAKHGDDYEVESGYRPWLPVVWPRATTDGSRPDLANKQ